MALVFYMCTKTEFACVLCSYTATAVVIHDKESCEIPYLDKFVISSRSQVRNIILSWKPFSVNDLMFDRILQQ